MQDKIKTQDNSMLGGYFCEGMIIMDKIPEYIATLFWALSFLIFFGPIITIVSIIGRVKVGLIDIDLSRHSKITRSALGLFGFAIWMAIYIPLVSLVFRAIPITVAPITVAPITVALTPEIHPTQPPTTPQTPDLALVQPTHTVTPPIVSTADPEAIIITEVMGNPCGDGNPRNEYVELYNSGSQPIVVGGWWITDGEETDKIVSWQERYPNILLGNAVVLNTTEIQPKSFAVILAPGYPFVEGQYKMPYRFPENTVILTLEKGYLIGDEQYGIEVTNRDIVVLYQGSEMFVEKVISSYGSPAFSSDPLSLRDDHKDRIPFKNNGQDCRVAERIYATNDDVESNWKEAQASLGLGSYP